MTKKFAVTKTTGDKIRVLREFGDDMEKAMAYGEEVAKDSEEASVACVLAEFNEKNQMNINEQRIFKVW